MKKKRKRERLSKEARAHVRAEGLDAIFKILRDARPGKEGRASGLLSSRNRKKFRQEPKAPRTTRLAIDFRRCHIRRIPGEGENP